MTEIPPPDRPERAAPEKARRSLAVVATAVPLTIYLSGNLSAPVPAMPFGAYYPVVGETVVVLEQPGDLFVLGPAGSPYWQSWLPTIRSSAAPIVLGAGGAIFGSVWRSGTTVMCRARVLFGGAGFSFPSGQFAISLPFPLNSAHNGQYFPVGQAVIYDASALVQRTWQVTRLDGASDCGVFNHLDGSYVTDVIPWIWTAGDYINVNAAYETNP